MCNLYFCDVCQKQTVPSSCTVFVTLLSQLIVTYRKIPVRDWKLTECKDCRHLVGTVPIKPTYGTVVPVTVFPSGFRIILKQDH